MVFSSMIFVWSFLPVFFVLNILCYKIGGVKLSNILLLCGSLIFYAWGEPKYIRLMLFSIFFNWVMGLLIDRCGCKKIVLVLCIVINLALLGYYKYFNLLISTANSFLHTSIESVSIILPIGISFFTFQALSYVVDVYRGDCEVQKSPFKMALYVSFFPQLIAGPIVKYKDISMQIDDRQITVGKTAEGVRRFVYGFAKKILISNVLAEGVDFAYSLPVEQLSSAMIWIAALAYTFQIYYDFSGYSDMAIGLGKIFGFEFRENFEYPYTSLSIREFWRRWHISLSSWFRDYVYIPLGGSRCKSIVVYRNLCIVFFLTGLWHGASYNFIVWGLYYGVFIIIERCGFDNILKKAPVFAWIYTFFIANIGWVFFRIEGLDMSLRYIVRMILPWNYTDTPHHIMNVFDNRFFVTLLMAIIGLGFVQRIVNTKQRIVESWKMSFPELIYCCVLMLLSYMSLAGNSYNPFIYFRF